MMPAWFLWHDLLSLLVAGKGGQPHITFAYLDPPPICCILPMPDIVALTLRVNKSLCIRETDKGGEMRVRWSKSCWMTSFQDVCSTIMWVVLAEFGFYPLRNCPSHPRPTRHFWNYDVPFLKMGIYVEKCWKDRTNGNPNRRFQCKSDCKTSDILQLTTAYRRISFHACIICIHFDLAV